MVKKYNLFYDVLTIIACLMVVFFHCNTIVYNYSDTVSWKISIIERCIVYSAIPMFFMLTGAKLLDYRSRYSTKEYAKKRLIRVGIPYLFWNIFYVFYTIRFYPEKRFGSVKEFVSMFINSEFQSRYWFFWPLFMVYLTIPVISLVLQAANHRKYLWYTVYLTFALRWMLMPLMSIFGIEYNSYMVIPVCSGYMAYVLFGYLISTEEWSRKKRIILYVLAICSGAFAAWYTIHTSAVESKPYLYMLSYDFFPSGLTGAAIFVFVKHLFSNSPELLQNDCNSKASKLIRNISGACMGVWLTHSLCITYLASITNLTIESYILRFVFPPIVFVICVIVVLIIKKIPIIKHIV